MIESKIRRSNAINLDYEEIRSAVRENMERAVERTAAAKKKLPYMRAIRAVCIALCVCMAAAMLTFIVNETNFWNSVTPPIPGPMPDGDTETQTSIEFEDIIIEKPPIIPTQNPDENNIGTTPPPAQASSPFKNLSYADQYDTFLAFATFVNPNVIINSNLLNSEDTKTFYEYAKQAKSKYYIIYMGVHDGVDSITILNWGHKGSFEFTSNLNYRYEDIITAFKEKSNAYITNEFLIGGYGNGCLDDGINLMFKLVDGVYIPYYEANLNGKAYIVDMQDAGVTGNTASEKIPFSEEHLSGVVIGSGVTSKMDEDIAESFDTFFSFGTFSFSSSAFSFLSDEDNKALAENRNGANYFDFYLGTKNGEDIVVVYNPMDMSTLTFRSNLPCSYNEIIESFEQLAKVNITDEFLTTSNYDPYLYREIGAISLCIKAATSVTDQPISTPYFRCKINGKIYVVDINQ